MKTFRSLLLLAGVSGAALFVTNSAAAGSLLGKEVNPRDLAVRHYVEPQFPLSLRLEATLDGYAQVVMLVSRNGKVTDTFVSDYSAEPFAREAVQSVSEWEFEPSTTAVRRVCVRFDFRREGVVLMTTASDALARQVAFIGLRAEEVRSYLLRELDQTPEPIVINAPAFPAALQGSGKSGFASVAFYIDETGAVRVPSVAQADEPAFGESAVSTVAGWKFQPPMKNGRPTRVFVVQDFAFGLPKKAK